MGARRGPIQCAGQHFAIVAPLVTRRIVWSLHTRHMSLKQMLPPGVWCRTCVRSRRSLEGATVRSRCGSSTPGHPSQCIVHEAHDVFGTLRGDARVEQTEVVVQDRPIDLPALEETRNLSMYLYVGMARGEHVDRAVCVVEAEPRVTCRRRMGEYPMVPVEHRIPDRAARLLQHAARGEFGACDVDDRVPHIVRQLHACVSSLRSVEEARGGGRV